MFTPRALKNIDDKGVLVTGTTKTIISQPITNQIAYLKRVEAVCMAISGGGPGSWELSSDFSSLHVELQLPTAPVVGQRLTWEFPIPLASDFGSNTSPERGTFSVEPTANVGDWFFTVNGAYEQVGPTS